MSDKKQILERLKEEFNRWEEVLASLSEAQITGAQLPPDLSIKDVITHLWAWQQLSIARMEAAVHGREPDFRLWPAEFDPDHDQEQINAWIRDTYGEKPWPDVHADWRTGFLHLLELGEAIPEADLMQPGRYPWLGAYRLYDVLEGSYGHHHEEHLEPLLDWLRQDGGMRGNR